MNRVVLHCRVKLVLVEHHHAAANGDGAEIPAVDVDYLQTVLGRAEQLASRLAPVRYVLVIEGMPEVEGRDAFAYRRN